MIANDHELQVTLERIARFQAQVAHLRQVEANPANYHAAAALWLRGMMADDILFELTTPLSFSVRATRVYWELIVTVKHPVMRGREAEVQRVLQTPDEMRRSRGDPTVLLLYCIEQPGRWLCAVAKRLNTGGFLIPTYPTDAIKEGERIWSK
jgi:hypothetical protein